MSATATKTISLTIEGRPVEVPEGTSILEAAKTAGLLIPHYCYHPGLPVAGSCRMCLVEVEKAPKLAPACATSVMEGQIVHVHSQRALEARKAVLEFLLINHPLDCPICDKSGECELQDFTFAEGPKESRLQDPKRFAPMEDFGGDVLYVRNRCILCTRCVRFMDDIAHEPVLNVSERGDRAYIGVAEGHDLTNPWAANVIDLCPVGALVSRDFLNKARSWDLDRTASICTGCSQGCNLVVETRDNTIVRMRPRPNDSVNQFYLCDVGRMTYKDFNRTDRVDQPLRRNGTALEIADWSDAIAGVAGSFSGKRVVVIASPNSSNESLFLLSEIIKRSGGKGVFHVERGPEAPLPGAPDLSLRAERAANGTGARLLGFTEVSGFDGTIGQGDCVLVVDDDLGGVTTDQLASASTVVYAGTVIPMLIEGLVDWVLPLTNVTEEEGTFTNLRGRVQRFLQARTAPGVARPSWYVFADLLSAMGDNAQYFLPSEVFAALAETHSEFSGMTYDSLGLYGEVITSNAGVPAGTGVGAA